MRHFKFITADSFDEAGAVLKEAAGKDCAIAGGTDLLGSLKDAILDDAPEALVSIEGIKDSSYIKEEEGCIRIGALTRLAEISDSELLREKLPAVAEAAHSVASPLIRNRATLGGNLCQDVRCWFYRYPHHGGGRLDCLRKGGSECFAIRGDNRYHSVFGGMKAGATPCSVECPAGTDIPGYMEKMRNGDIAAAAEILMQFNPLSMMTSRVCAHTCQTKCNRNSTDQSVSVHAVERALGDYILEHTDDFYSAPKQESGRKVAVAGAGPAGLTAAFYLRKAGHQVTVFDALEEPGGCLMYAIPAFRLPKHYVKEVVGALKKMGVLFRQGVKVGEEIKAEELEKNYDKIFYATGAWGRPVLGFDGEEFTEFGLQFLVDVNKWVMKKQHKEVLVVGGGNVSMDVAITAKRLGAHSVTLACLEERDEMPASVEEIARAEEEGIKIINGYGVKRAICDAGVLTGLELKKCTALRDETGRFNPSYDENDTMTLNSDSVLMAAGQKVDLSFIEEKYNLAVNRGLIKVETETQRTSRGNVFAGGDATTGPTTVIKAIRSGRNAAEAINTEFGIANPMKYSQSGFLKFADGCASMKTAAADIELSASERALDKEDSFSLSGVEAAKEANRCMNCGCYSVNASDLSPVMVALQATIVTNKKSFPAEDLFTTELKAYNKLDADELITEIVLPKLAGYKTHYEKFRMRDSIDFAMASMASVYKLANGIVEDLRIVLGAVAPVPVQAKEAERLLIGKKPTEALAKEAAELAAAGAAGIGHNDYKVKEIKTFVERLVLKMAEESK